MTQAFSSRSSCSTSPGGSVRQLIGLGQRRGLRDVVRVRLPRDLSGCRRGHPRSPSSVAPHQPGRRPQQASPPAGGVGSVFIRRYSKRVNEKEGSAWRCNEGRCGSRPSRGAGLPHPGQRATASRCTAGVGGLGAVGVELLRSRRAPAASPGRGCRAAGCCRGRGGDDRRCSSWCCCRARSGTRRTARAWPSLLVYSRFSATAMKLSPLRNFSYARSADLRYITRSPKSGRAR